MVVLFTSTYPKRRFKLEPSGKKGIFVGYNESSKPYRIYIPGQKLIELSKDVIFEEDVALKRSKDINEIDDESPLNMEEDHASEIKRDTHETIEDNNHNEPMDFADEPIDPTVNRKRPLLARKMIQEAENYAAPKGTFRERKRPNRYSSYVALMSEIIESKPSSVEEAFKHQVWEDDMTKEYQSILKNDVWTLCLDQKTNQ